MRRMKAVMRRKQNKELTMATMRKDKIKIHTFDVFVASFFVLVSRFLQNF